MTLTVGAEPVPLTTTDDGAVRVAGTRVTLDTVIAGFLHGATPEELAYQYPSLNLADIYVVIAYYLRRQSDVEGYLQDRQRRADAVRAENERRFDPAGVRVRLVARRGGC